MTSRSDIGSDQQRVSTDITNLLNENQRLRDVNAKMLAALTSVLPILQEDISPTGNYDRTERAVAKVQDAIAAAEQD